MVFALIFSILPTINANADTTWNLAWSDEFNGSTINKANWISETGTGSGGWGVYTYKSYKVIIKYLIDGRNVKI